MTLRRTRGARARRARSRAHASRRSCSRSVNAAAVMTSAPFSSRATTAVVVVVDHREQRRPSGGTSAPPRRAAPPQRPVLVLERGREADRILDRRRLDHEPAVLVVLVLHRVRRDRVDHVGVLRLVEEAVDEAHGMEAEVAADESRARAVRQAGSQEELRRVDAPRGDDDRAGVDALRVPSPSTYSTPFASPSSITTRSTGASARSSSRPAAHASWMYVFSVDLPAFVGQPCRHEPQLMQFASVYACTGSSVRAERAERPARPCARSCASPRAHERRAARSTRS